MLGRLKRGFINAIDGTIPARVAASATARLPSESMRFLQRNINEANKMEYVIVFSTVAVVALYALIVARWLRKA